MNLDRPWEDSCWVRQTQIILDSYERWLGAPLISRDGSVVEQSNSLFSAPFVVVSHGTQDDPILNYANKIAVELWETDLATLLQTPSRETAEPVHQSERARMMERTTQEGYIANYQSIRVSMTGRRFRMDDAVVWNLIDEDDKLTGQAATFSKWEFL